jgi:hypothetical protein
MSELIEGQISKLVEKTMLKGDDLRYSIEAIARAAGFSIPEIVKKGAICADVEYGSEGYALLPFHPKVLVLGEPEGATAGREKEISAALAVFSKLPVTIKRSDATDLIDDLYREGVVQNVGLITWLNIFPEIADCGPGTVRHFGTSSEKLLAPSGRVIMSLVEDDESRQKLIDDVIAQGIPGLRLLKLSRLRSAASAGNLILVGEKLP